MESEMTGGVFLITVDTEGDDLWSRPHEITTRNARFLPRFQSLCEAHGLKPTYLTNYEMAVSHEFQEFGRELLARKTGEIGMHLHAWNSPPLRGLTEDDYHHRPYLVEYPLETMRDKVRVLTDLLEDTFGVKMVSHRAGRWFLTPAYARILVECGYLVDCSVTPHVSWKRTMGDPRGRGGPDYSLYPEMAYFVDLEDLSRQGHSPLLEVPVTILSRRRPVCRLLPAVLRSAPLVQRALDRLLPADWLAPKRRNREAMATVVPRALSQHRPYVELAIHSSELMPGGSPNFRTEAEIESLYERLEVVFESSRGRFRGRTLAEFREAFPSHAAS
jgi:hypothetical protein